MTSLRARGTRNAAIWTISSGLTFSLNLVGFYFLSRILPPAEFGIAAALMVVLSIAESISDFGLTSALVTSAKGIEAAGGTAAVLRLSLACLAALLLAAIAPGIASVFHEPALVVPVQVGSAYVVTASVGFLPMARMTKRIEFGKLSAPKIVRALCYNALLLTLGSWGFSYWSVVWALIASGLVGGLTAILMMSAPFTLSFQRSAARDLLSYGRHVVAIGVIGYVSTNIDSTLVATLFGVSSLGLYYFGFQWAIRVTAPLSGALSQVLFPIYVEARESPNRLRAGVSETIALVAIAVSFTGMIAFSVAGPVIELVFGSRWLGAVDVFRTVVPVGILSGLSGPLTALCLATNRPEINTKLALLNLTVVGLTIYPLANLAGIEGAAAAVLMGAIVGYAYLVSAVSKILGSAPSKLIRPALAPLGGAILGASLATGTLSVLPTGLIAVAAGIGVCSITFGLIVLRYAQPELTMALKLFSTLLRAGSSRGR